MNRSQTAVLLMATVALMSANADFAKAQDTVEDRGHTHRVEARGCADGKQDKAVSLDCLLHPGILKLSGNSACPNVTPYLTAKGFYTCEVCNISKTGPPLEATGVGDCFLGTEAACEPVLLGWNFQVSWASVAILNRLWIGTQCKPNRQAFDLVSCNCGHCEQTPIIIGLGQSGISLTSAADGVAFDLTADGNPERTAWTTAGSESAFLVLDRNENGVIDDGSELFGNSTAQPVFDISERNGFEALAVFDDSLSGGNEDGVIDQRDEIFSELRLWIDSNHNGVSDSTEIFHLGDHDVTSFNLKYRTTARVDQHGNAFRYVAKATIGGRTKLIWDVIFVVASEKAN